MTRRAASSMRRLGRVPRAGVAVAATGCRYRRHCAGGSTTGPVPKMADRATAGRSCRGRLQPAAIVADGGSVRQTSAGATTSSFGRTPARCGSSRRDSTGTGRLPSSGISRSHRVHRFIHTTPESTEVHSQGGKAAYRERAGRKSLSAPTLCLRTRAYSCGADPDRFSCFSPQGWLAPFPGRCQPPSGRARWERLGMG